MQKLVKRVNTKDTIKIKKKFPTVDNLYSLRLQNNNKSRKMKK